MEWQYEHGLCTGRVAGKINWFGIHVFACPIFVLFVSVLPDDVILNLLIEDRVVGFHVGSFNDLQWVRIRTANQPGSLSSFAVAGRPKIARLAPRLGCEYADL